MAQREWLDRLAEIISRCEEAADLDMSITYQDALDEIKLTLDEWKASLG
jgi:hypothetical protein